MEVSEVSIIKGEWNRQRFLDGKKEDFISTYLIAVKDIGDKLGLSSNSKKSFQGVITLGTGFLISPDKKEDLINDGAGENFIKPYLIGDDLNTSFNQSPSRFAIDVNLFDNEGKFKKEQPKLFSFLKSSVFEDRQMQSDVKFRTFWWKYLRPRPELYESISNKRKVLAISTGGTKYVVFEFVSPKILFANTIAIISNDTFNYFAILSSTIHNEWAWKYCSKKGGSTLRYTPSDGFETFPFPPSEHETQQLQLEILGETYYSHRKKLMLDTQLGLTNIYNLFHSSEIRDHIISEIKKQVDFLGKHFGEKIKTTSYDLAIKGIFKLRDLHKKMDYAVLDAYGWNDIDLRHDFYEMDYLPENDRVRFTIHPDARKEILKRLLELNHQIFEEEARQGCHKIDTVKEYFKQKGREVTKEVIEKIKQVEKEKKAADKKNKDKRKKRKGGEDQTDLFGE